MHKVNTTGAVWQVLIAGWLLTPTLRDSVSLSECLGFGILSATSLRRWLTTSPVISCGAAIAVVVSAKTPATGRS